MGMLTPTESSNRFSILLMEQDSVLLTLVSPLLLSMMALLPPSTLSLLLPLPSTQSSPLPLLRGRDVRLDLPTDLELPTPPLMPPMGMLAFLMLMVFHTTDKLLTGKFKFCAIFVFKCSMCDEHRR